MSLLIIIPIIIGSYRYSSLLVAWFIPPSRPPEATPSAACRVSPDTPVQAPAATPLASLRMLLLLLLLMMMMMMLMLWLLMLLLLMLMMTTTSTSPLKEQILKKRAAQQRPWAGELLHPRGAAASASPLASRAEDLWVTKQTK